MTLENIKRISTARTKHQRQLSDIEYHLRMGDCGDDPSEHLSEFITMCDESIDALIELAQCFASVASEEDMRENLSCYVQGTRALEILDKLTSGGEG
jgi:hypothetical protein